MPLLNMRLARPRVLVDLNRVAELSYVQVSDGGLAIGAMTRQRTLEDHPLVAERLPLLAELAGWIGHPQIRTRGTVGGSIAHADPAGELPAAAIALDAELTVVSARGTRTLSTDELLLGYLETSLAPDEILAEVRISRLPPETGWSIQEIARRKGDFALVGVLAVVTMDQTRIRSARVAYFGVGGRPVRVPAVERVLEGEMPSEKVFEVAAREASAAVQPDDDVHATAAYRRSVAGTLTRRALREAIERARVRGA